MYSSYKEGNVHYPALARILSAIYKPDMSFIYTRSALDFLNDPVAGLYHGKRYFFRRNFGIIIRYNGLAFLQIYPGVRHSGERFERFFNPHHAVIAGHSLDRYRDSRHAAVDRLGR